MKKYKVCFYAVRCGRVDWKIVYAESKEQAISDFNTNTLQPDRQLISIREVFSRKEKNMIDFTISELYTIAIILRQEYNALEHMGAYKDAEKIKELLTKVEVAIDE